MMELLPRSTLGLHLLLRTGTLAREEGRKEVLKNHSACKEAFPTFLESSPSSINSSQATAGLWWKPKGGFAKRCLDAEFLI